MLLFSGLHDRTTHYTIPKSDEDTANLDGHNRLIRVMLNESCISRRSRPMVRVENISEALEEPV